MAKSMFDIQVDETWLHEAAADDLAAFPIELTDEQVDAVISRAVNQQDTDEMLSFKSWFYQRSSYDLFIDILNDELRRYCYEINRITEKEA